MKLQRLEIKRFGCFEDFVVEFTEGLQVVVGDNESGKSTIVQALWTILFEDPTRLADESLRFHNWGSAHPFLLHLEYQEGGKNYTLTKDVATGTTLLEEVETGNKWKTFKDVQTHIARALGFNESEFYQATAFVKQGDLAGVTQNVDLIKDKLEGMLNNNKDEILASHLSGKLRARLAKIHGVDPDHCGEVAMTRRKIENWQNELDAISARTADLLKTKRRKAEIGNELELARRQFEDKHGLFKKSKLAFEAEQSLNKEREAFLDLNRRTKDAFELKSLILSKKESLKSMIRVERADLKSTESLATQNQLNFARLESAATRCQKEEEAAGRARPRIWYKLLTAGAVLATLVCAFLWRSSHDSLFLSVGVGTTVVLIIASMIWFSARQAYHHARSKEEETDARRQEEQDNYQKSNETLQALLRRFNIKSVDELAELYEQYHDLDRDLKALTARYDTLLGDNKLKDLETDLEKMTTRMNRQQETFDKYRTYALPAQQLELLQKEVTELDRKLRQLEEESTAIENKLQHSEAGTDIMAPMQERIEEGEKIISRLCREEEALSIVSRYLEEARRRVLKSSIEILEEGVSSLLGSFTGGKWCQAKLDRQTLACEVSPDGEGWQPASTALSTGAMNSLYLAMRLALVKVISTESRPPVVLDDALLFFDQHRCHEAMALLKDLSQSYQVLFFTADQRSTKWADHVIDLGSTTSRPTASSRVTTSSL